MTVAYASSEKLAEFLELDAPPAAATKLLRRASSMVREATLTAFWEQADDGLPKAQSLRSALADATCLQIEAWLDADVDPFSAPKMVAATKTLGKASRTYTGILEHLQNEQRLRDCLCDEAMQVLHSAGLIGDGPIDE